MIKTLYLALGTNLGSLQENIERATQLIAERIGRVVKTATPIETLPVGFKSANAFLNSAIEVQTELTVDEVLLRTQQIEHEMGRTLKSHNGVHYDRIIDIDLLFYADVQIHTPQLTLPHPHIAERLFVLEPLAEIAPQLQHPYYGQTISELLATRQRCHMVRLTETMCTPQLFTAVNHLLQQLSSSAHALTLDELRSLSAEHNALSHVVLLYACVPEPGTQQLCALTDLPNPIGMATLCVCQQPTGRKAWIEDVVIDKQWRGLGLSRPLLRHLIAIARSEALQSVNLTSRPERVAANLLYQSLGFVQRTTNVYKMALDTQI